VPRLPSSKEFFDDISERISIKVSVVLATFIALVFPVAIAITIGLPGNAGLVLICVLFLPMMYVSYSFLAALLTKPAIVDQTTALSIGALTVLQPIHQLSVPSTYRLLKLPHLRQNGESARISIETPNSFSFLDLQGRINFVLVKMTVSPQR
jgi:hypothetical protein